MNTMYISKINSLLFILIISLVFQVSAGNTYNQATENIHIKRDEYSYKTYGQQYTDGLGTKRVHVSYHDDTGKRVKYVSVVIDADILSEMQEQEELEQQKKDEEAKKQQELEEQQQEEEYEREEDKENENSEDTENNTDNKKHGSKFKSLLWSGDH